MSTCIACAKNLVSYMISQIASHFSSSIPLNQYPEFQHCFLSALSKCEKLMCSLYALKSANLMCFLYKLCESGHASIL